MDVSCVYSVNYRECSQSLWGFILIILLRFKIHQSGAKLKNEIQQRSEMYVFWKNQEKNPPVCYQVPKDDSSAEFSSISCFSYKALNTPSV